MDDAGAYWTMFAATDHWDCGGWTTDSRTPGVVACACGAVLAVPGEART